MLFRTSNIIKRSFKTSSKSHAKVVMALYEDPQAGYPPPSLRDDLPVIDKYPDGQTLPSPDAVDFQPGDLLGSVSGELGLRKFLEDRGHTLVVTSDKDGADCMLTSPVFSPTTPLSPYAYICFSHIQNGQQVHWRKNLKMPTLLYPNLFGPLTLRQSE